jgi:hypothetical protein
MKTLAETNLIEFLTNSDNLPFAVEILRLGDEIRRPILARFWRDLHRRLEESRDRSLDAASMQLRLVPDERLTNPLDTDLSYGDVRMENAEQSLSYFVEKEYGKNYFAIYFGIAWRDEMPSKSSKLHKLKPVSKLREKLEEMEFETRFEKTITAMGWQALLKYDSLDDFLADFAKEPEGILREITDRFWLLVKKTITAVEQANAAIIGRTDE